MLVKSTDSKSFKGKRVSFLGFNHLFTLDLFHNKWINFCCIKYKNRSYLLILERYFYPEIVCNLSKHTKRYSCQISDSTKRNYRNSQKNKQHSKKRKIHPDSFNIFLKLTLSIFTLKQTLSLTFVFLIPPLSKSYRVITGNSEYQYSPFLFAFPSDSPNSHFSDRLRMNNFFSFWMNKF